MINSEYLKDFPSSTFRNLIVILLFSLGVILLLSSYSLKASVEGEYVYYFYVPPAVANLSKPVKSWAPQGDVYVGTEYNYSSFPSNLDIIGIEDNTNYHLYDLSTRELIRSGSLSKYQRVTITFGEYKTSTEPFEVEDYYLKLVTDKPVSALLWGGLFEWEKKVLDVGGGIVNSLSKFVPSVEGGFIGKEFVFLTFPTYWQPAGKLYTEEINKYNIFATEDAKVKIYDSQGSLVQELSVGKLSMARTSILDPWKVYRIESSGNIMIYGTSMDSMTYVPSLTGGYVGRDFIATRPGDVSRADKQSFIVVALEDAKVSLYDMRKPAGSAADNTIEVKRGEMAFDTSMLANIPVRVKSTGDITLLIGGNEYGWGSTWVEGMGYIVPEYISEDIALLGAKEGQEIGFYAPYRAIVFAAGDTEVEINGIPRSMRKDEFITLASGTYIVKPSSAPLIVEVLGKMNVVQTEMVAGGLFITAYLREGFDDWGAYLISPDILYKTYAPVEEAGGMDILLYAGAGAAVAVVAIVIVFMSRRGKKK